MEKPITKIEKSSGVYKMIISSNLEKKIRYLCNKVFNVEWSGALFYTYSGSFENNDLTITGIDLLLLDIGTSTYTEFDMSPKVIAYMAEHPELLDCQIGLVHSHSVMAAFFSGTDLQTLKEEGIDRNHFVSLIVNNEGTYTAAITRRITSVKNVSDTYTYKSFNDNDKQGENSYKVEETYILYNYLDIVKEDTNSNFTELEEQIKEVKQDKHTIRVDVKPAGFNNIPQLSLFKEDGEPIGNISSTKINQDVVKTIAIQLITGSILASSSTNINLNEWITRMPALFDKRFRDEESFKLWCSLNIEFILADAVPDKYLKMQDDYINDLAIELYDFIYKLPKNKYLDLILLELEEWTVKM